MPNIFFINVRVTFATFPKTRFCITSPPVEKLHKRLHFANSPPNRHTRHDERLGRKVAFFHRCLTELPPPALLSPRAATFPDELGMSVPLVEEEQRELLYVPLDGEWGCRMRADECERIIKAMDQLCTLGV